MSDKMLELDGSGIPREYYPHNQLEKMMLATSYLNAIQAATPDEQLVGEIITHYKQFVFSEETKPTHNFIAFQDGSVFTAFLSTPSAPPFVETFDHVADAVEIIEQRLLRYGTSKPLEAFHNRSPRNV